MSTQVDNRVVSMKFDNRDFEKNVRTSMSTLEQLEKSLQVQNGGKGLAEISKTAKGIDFSQLQNGLETSSKGFSKLEVMAITALANITNSVVNLGKKLVSGLIAPITSGGLSRAMNLEQANFQLSGLGIEKNDTASYYTEVMDAVLGTAYSYDVAAKAASQLAASDVGVMEVEKKMLNGETKMTKHMTGEMTDAILGIAGVAAMTGSSFDDISQIFTRVAGQGKVMANDLNSISSRGLNAAATLAKYLHVSEAEVRDMVSKGKIDFETFSKAMTEAFGAHAKDATKTFTGALEDVKAALARIGADFYGPGLPALRDILNSLTPLVDVVHDKIQWALDSIGIKMGAASKKISGFLDLMSVSGSQFIDEVGNRFPPTASIIKKGVASIADSTAGLKKGSVNAFKILTKSMQKISRYSNLTVEETKKLVDEGKIPFIQWAMALEDYVKSGKRGSSEIRAYLADLGSEMRRYENIADNLGITNGVVKDSFQSIANIMDTDIDKVYEAVGEKLEMTGDEVKQALENGSLGAVQLRNALNDLVAEGAMTDEQLRNIMDSIDWFILGDESFVKTIEDAQTVWIGLTSTLGIFKDIAIQLGAIFVSLLARLAPLGSFLTDNLLKFSEWIAEVRKSGIVTKTFDKAIKTITETIHDFANAVNKGNQLTEVFHKSVDLLHGGMDELKDFFKSVTDVIMSIAPLIGSVGKGMGTFVNFILSLVGQGLNHVIDFFSDTANFFKILSTLNIAIIAQNMTKFFDAFDFDKLKESLDGVTEKFTEAIDSIVEALGSKQKIVNAAYIRSLASSLLMLAIAFKILSGIDAGGVAKAAIALKIMMASITAMLVSLAESLTQLKGFRPKKFLALTKGLIPIAFAILILSLAMSKIGKLGLKDAAIGLAAVEILLWSMKDMLFAMAGISKVVKNPKGLIGMTFSLILIAAAVRIFASSIAKLGGLSKEELLKGGGAFVAIIMVIGLFTDAMNSMKLDGSMGSTMMALGASMVLMAASLKIIAGVIADLGQLNQDEIIKGAGVFAGILTALGLFVFAVTQMKLGDSFGKDIMAVGASMILLAIGIRIFASAVIKLGEIPLANLAKGLGAIAIALGSFLAVMHFSKGSDLVSVGAGVLIFAGALLVLSTAFKVMASIPFDKMFQAGAAFFLTLISLAAMAPALGEASIALMMFGKALMLISASFLVLGIGFVAIGAGLTAISTGLMSLGTSISSIPMLIASVIIGVVEGIAQCKVEIVRTFADIVTLLTAEIAAQIPTLLGYIDTIITGILELIAKQGEPIVVTVLNLIEMILQKLYERSRSFAELALGIISELCEGIAEGIPQIIDAAWDVIIALIDGLSAGLDEHAPELRDAMIRLGKSCLDAIKTFFGIHSPSTVMKGVGDNIVQGLINGIKAKISSAIQTVRSFGISLWNAIKEKVSAWRTVGSNMIQGLWNGLSGLKDWVVRKVSAMGSSILDAIKRVLGIKSPSRKFAEVGKYSMLGLAKGLDDYGGRAIGASTDVGKAMIDAIQNSADRAGDIMNLNPTITPVIDLSNATSAAKKFDSMFSARQAMALTSRITADGGAQRDSMDNLVKAIEGMNNSNTQNNYITVDGAEDPFLFADKLVRGLKLNARTM